jgi:methionyl aminopeptidase
MESKKYIAMKQGGKILATILNEIRSKTVVGTKTSEINDMAKRLCLKYHVKPSFLNYDGYPAAICVSINDQIVHGIPGDYQIKNGDIVSLDFGVELNGYHTDSAISFGVGNIDAEAHRLLKVTEDALYAAISKVKPGLHIGVIGATVQNHVESNGFGVVRSLVGHGISKNVHEEPYIPNFGSPTDGPIIKEGMTLAIEPMTTIGDYAVALDSDNWTYFTASGELSAHFEHTIYVTKDGCEILTKV